MLTFRMFIAKRITMHTHSKWKLLVILLTMVYACLIAYNNPNRFCAEKFSHTNSFTYTVIELFIYVRSKKVSSLTELYCNPVKIYAKFEYL